MRIVPLEDNFEDILGKAMRGRGMMAKELTAISGASEIEILSLLQGEFSAELLRQIAPTLELATDSLIELAQKSWQPAQVEMKGLRQFVTPFEDFTVGSYLIWDPETLEAAMFDTGSSVSEAYDVVQSLGLSVKQLFITHTHPDHIMAASEIMKWGGVMARTLDKEPAPEAEVFVIGEEFQIGALKVSTRLTWGHSEGGVTYVVEGLERPVAIVGDAIFAQSMGGGGVSYEAALETNRKEILTLPDETVLCPGHGPMSSVAEEKAHNPFFPEFK